MSDGALGFVIAVRRRLAWLAGLRGARRTAAWVALPALLCCGAGWWAGWRLLGPAAAVVTGTAVGLAAWLAWRRAPSLGSAAVTADRALGLPGLLTTATAEGVGAPPAGFAAAVARRAAQAVVGRRAGQVVALGRAAVREGGVAAVVLAVVTGLASVPTATARERASVDEARLDRAAGLLALARSVEAGGDGALAAAIRRAGRGLAAPPNEHGGETDPDATAALEREIAGRHRTAARAQAALDRLEAGDLHGAARLSTTGSPERTALDAAARAPAGSAARAAAIDAAAAELESKTAATSGSAGLFLAEAAARVRTARTAQLARHGAAPNTGPDGGRAGGAEAGGGTAGGSGRSVGDVEDSALASAPTIETRLAAIAPRILGRPVWTAADDDIVRRYFDTTIGIPTQR